MRMWVWSLASLSGLGSGIAGNCGVGHKCRSDPTLLWLWRRPAAAAPTRPLAWELLYTTGAALKSKIKIPKKKKKPPKEKNRLKREQRFELCIRVKQWSTKDRKERRSRPGLAQGKDTLLTRSAGASYLTLWDNDTQECLTIPGPKYTADNIRAC